MSAFEAASPLSQSPRRKMSPSIKEQPQSQDQKLAEFVTPEAKETNSPEDDPGVQVIPSSQPRNDILPPSMLPAKIKPSQSQAHIQAQDDDLGETDEDGEEEEELASDSDLTDFDWKDFEHRYTDALNQIYAEEQVLTEQFDALSLSFSVWQQASSLNDGERAVKRLKTRERYVQLSEESLKEKKEHYGRVVDAFKTALELLNT